MRNVVKIKSVVLIYIHTHTYWNADVVTQIHTNVCRLACLHKNIYTSKRVSPQTRVYAFQACMHKHTPSIEPRLCTSTQFTYSQHQWVESPQKRRSYCRPYYEITGRRVPVYQFLLSYNACRYHRHPFKILHIVTIRKKLLIINIYSQHVKPHMIIE